MGDTDGLVWAPHGLVAFAGRELLPPAFLSSKRTPDAFLWVGTISSSSADSSRVCVAGVTQGGLVASWCAAHSALARPHWARLRSAEDYSQRPAALAALGNGRAWAALDSGDVLALRGLCACRAACTGTDMVFSPSRVQPEPQEYPGRARKIAAASLGPAAAILALAFPRRIDVMIAFSDTDILTLVATLKLTSDPHALAFGGDALVATLESGAVLAFLLSPDRSSVAAAHSIASLPAPGDIAHCDEKRVVLKFGGVVRTVRLPVMQTEKGRCVGRPKAPASLGVDAGPALRSAIDAAVRAARDAVRPAGAQAVPESVREDGLAGFAAAAAALHPATERLRAASADLARHAGTLRVLAAAQAHWAADVIARFEHVASHSTFTLNAPVPAQSQRLAAILARLRALAPVPRQKAASNVSVADAVEQQDALLARIRAALATVRIDAP